ncbi:hypothetical protein CAPN008_14190 [Capnocytophaga canis]|uniref:AAA family ATPase n=1 Tax=Capnocytophaga canis TaxID=1848903 RepID=UPI001AD3DA52|nr:AAA family ATPase [Capnocytophaga canis]GIM61369.1 hypothetical protein CAPN008_14190 [Capnocytophaga canis]
MIKIINSKEEDSEFGREWFDAQYSEAFVDVSKAVERPETIISIGRHLSKGVWRDTEVMTAGEFSVISAPSKSKKSFFKSQLCASYIGGNANEYFREIKGHRKGDAVIIDCDTEQSEFYSHRTFKRIEKITGFSYQGYLPFKMRHMETEQRVAFIDQLIERYRDKVKLVFIDGIADLINDTNDLVLSNYIAGKLLRWTDKYKVHICIVIHNAYGMNKPTGHLGSAVVKKAETVFQLSIDKEKTPDVVKVTHQYSRGRSFEDFYFKVNEDSLIQECDINGDFHNTLAINEKPIPTATPSQAFGKPKNDVPF